MQATNPDTDVLPAPVQDIVDALDWRQASFEGRTRNEAYFDPEALEAILSGLRGLQGMPELVQIYCSVAELASRLHQQGQGTAAAQLLPIADALEAWAFEVECPEAGEVAHDDGEAIGASRRFERFAGAAPTAPVMANAPAPAGAMGMLALRCNGASDAAPRRRRRRPL